jgi:hypothetical protein
VNVLEGGVKTLFEHTKTIGAPEVWGTDFGVMELIQLCIVIHIFVPQETLN